MIRRTLIGILVIALTACTPELLPRPITPGPTLAPATATPVILSGAVISPADLASIHMLDTQNGWGISDTKVLRTADGGAKLA